MKNLLNAILLTLILNPAIAQIAKSGSETVDTEASTEKGIWLQISYALGDCPFKKKEILFFKGNTIKCYVGKSLKHTYPLNPFKISYQYSMRCIKAPCPMGEAVVTVYYNETLNGSLKVQTGQFYFIDLYPVDTSDKIIKEGHTKWTIKATVIRKIAGINP